MKKLLSLLLSAVMLLVPVIGSAETATGYGYFTIANPILGAIYAFFFSNKIGKQLTKAVLTTVILTVLVLLLCHFGFGIIPVGQAVLISYIPLLGLLLILWYLIGHTL